MRFRAWLLWLLILVGGVIEAKSVPSVKISPQEGSGGARSGYQFYRISYRNPEAAPRRVECLWQLHGWVKKTLFLPGNESGVLEVGIPLTADRNSPGTLFVYDEDGTQVEKSPLDVFSPGWEVAYSNRLSAQEAEKIHDSLQPSLLRHRAVSVEAVGAWPTDCRAYLGGRWIILPDAEFENLTTTQQDALLKFVALGGVLVKTDSGMRDQAERIYGRGRIVELPRSPERWSSLDFHGDEAQVFDVKQAQLKAPMLALRGIFWVMTVFCVAFGPLCYWALLKLGKLSHILWILPASSGLFVGGLVMFAGVSEGWGTKSALNSLTFLDQKSGLAVSGGTLEYYAALTEPRGMEFSDKMIFLYAGLDSSPILNLTDGQRFYGGVARPRMVGILPFRRVEFRSERLLVRRISETELEVENALNARLLEVEVRDGIGHIYRGAEPIESGKKALLKRENGKVVLNWRGRNLGGLVPPGGYAAQLEATPFLEPGARAKQEDSWLIGTLEAQP